jgi:hypothetical protein
MSRKNILVLSAMCIYSLSLTAQIHPTNFEKYWKEIDSLTTIKGLSRTALVKVDLIYKTAKKEKNDAEVIKALIYKMNLNLKPGRTL